MNIDNAVFRTRTSLCCSKSPVIVRKLGVDNAALIFASVVYKWVDKSSKNFVSLESP